MDRKTRQKQLQRILVIFGLAVALFIVILFTLGLDFIVNPKKELDYKAKSNEQIEYENAAITTEKDNSTTEVEDLWEDENYFTPSPYNEQTADSNSDESSEEEDEDDTEEETTEETSEE